MDFNLFSTIDIELNKMFANSLYHYYPQIVRYLNPILLSFFVIVVTMKGIKMMQGEITV